MPLVINQENMVIVFDKASKMSSLFEITFLGFLSKSITVLMSFNPKDHDKGICSVKLFYFLSMYTCHMYFSSNASKVYNHIK